MSQLTWEDFPRKHDRIAFLGFSAVSRDRLPWDDTDLEVFSLNEGYNFPWVKRWDRWFQIHPRWDFIRSTNNNDPNHILWLTNQEGKCIQCRGGGRVIPLIGKDKTEMNCPACGGTGHYKPPANRMDPAFPIYMQRHWDDIPLSIPLPLKEISKALIPKINTQQDYFTSSFSMMLGLAFIMGYKRVELYGFEMGADTEYHYQRANAEYLMGLVQGRGMEVYIPKESPLLVGPLYGYKSMKQGYRQHLDMRLRFLMTQLDNESRTMMSMHGEIAALKKVKAWLEAEKDKLNYPKEVREWVGGQIANMEADEQTKLGLANGIKFAMEETKNLTKMYDNYFWMGTEGGDEDITREPEDVSQHVMLRYGTNEKTQE